MKGENFMKKKIYALIFICTILLTLTGCGSSSSSSGYSKSEYDKAKQDVINANNNYYRNQ